MNAQSCICAWPYSSDIALSQTIRLLHTKKIKITDQCDDIIYMIYDTTFDIYIFFAKCVNNHRFLVITFVVTVQNRTPAKRNSNKLCQILFFKSFRRLYNRSGVYPIKTDFAQQK